MDDFSDIQNRKDGHLKLALEADSQSAAPTGLDRVQLTHQALPEQALADVSTTTSFMGRDISLPLMIGAMTGGSAKGDAINCLLARLAAKHQIPLAVGSQRAALEAGKSPDLRKQAGDALLISNLGGLQLAETGGVDLARRAVDTLQADALAIHLNPLQEAVQPEGGGDWRGVLSAIEETVTALPCPVMVKEVGAGLSRRVIEQLYAVGVRYVDVAGRGGTNWTRIEQKRLPASAAGTYDPFLEWGIPTLEAVQQAHASRGRLKDMTLIASGGIRHGLDIVRALWLGADMTAAAGPFLHAVMDKPEALAEAHFDALMQQWQTQMRLAMFLTGVSGVQAIPQIDGTIA
ncbi:MAG: type 2 isopentenyl-diphosphate Delta-isomerase [Parvibaculales bacterium]